MIRFLGLVLAFGLLVGATAVAVERFDDRELLVPGPDVVAEEFVRAVVNGRYEPARARLADESSMTEIELRTLQAQLGDPSEIEAEGIARDDTRALASVRVSSASESEAVAFTLVFDYGWKIVR